MTEVASAFVSLMPSAKGFGSRLDREVSGEVNSTGKKLGAGFGKAFAAGGALLAAAGVGSFLKDSIGEAREAQKVGALTESIIKSTGGAAKVTAGQVGDLAGAISLKTGMDDEAIQSGANLLLTFKNVKREGTGLSDIFGRATAAAADLSAAGFGDLNGQAKMLGKALNDPIRGITALSRSGVTFTDQQKAQIKALVESGDTLKAQKIIMAEVESQVGGAAAASATYGEKASVAFGNIKEQIGTALLPAVDGLAKAFLSTVPTITKLIDGIGPAFSRVSAFVTPVAAQIRGLFGGGSGGGVLASVKVFAASVGANLVPVLRTMATTFTTSIIPAVTAFASFVASRLVPVFQQVIGIITTRVIPIYATMAKFIYGELIPAYVQIYANIAQKLKPVFEQLATTFRAQVLPAVDKLLAKFQEWQPTIQKVLVAVLRVTGKVLEFAAAVVAKVLPPLIKFQGFLISKIVPAIGDVIGRAVTITSKMIEFGGAMVDAVKKAGQFLSGVKDKIGQALDFIQGIPDKIKGFFANAGTLLKTIGGQIVDGLKSGIEGSWHKVTAVVDSLIARIPKKIREMMGIASPSKVTTILGQYIGEGLAKGLEGSRKKIANAAERVVETIRNKLDTKRGKLADLLSDFESLASGVAQAFAGNLFDVSAIEADAEAGVAAKSAGQAFIDNLMGKRGELKSLLADFKTLQGWGLPASFLSQLFASGNGAVISDLAAMGQGEATNAAALFGEVTDLGNQLGMSVANNELSKGIANVRDEIAGLRADMEVLVPLIGKDVGKAVNDGATNGNTKRNPPKKKPKKK